MILNHPPVHHSLKTLTTNIKERFQGLKRFDVGITEEKSYRLIVRQLGDHLSI